jgi:hypothetical protein
MSRRIIGIGLAALLTAGLAGFSSSGFAGDAATIELAAQKHTGGGKGAPKAKAVNRNVTAKKNVNVNKKVNVNRNVNVKKNVHVNRTVNVNRHVTYSRGYRAWSRRPYYGSVFIGAVALGTVIAVTAPHVIPVAPGPNACWYWSDPAEINGYWDYCVPPP